MMTGKRLGTATLLIALAFGSLSAQAESRTVVASILPIHSLVAGLVGEIHTIEVLLPASASPHGYAMRPSEARRLQDAQLLIWVGPDLETFLARPLSEPLDGTTVINLMNDLELDLLPVRKGGIWEIHDHDDPGEVHAHDHRGHDHNDRRHDHGHHGHGHADENKAHDDPASEKQDRDAHLWLSPSVARQIVAGLTERLALWDPTHAENFERNRDILIARIDALEADLARQIEPVQNRPFLVFHDAYQYFENHFGLKAAGSITLDPSLSPGARRVQELRTRLQADDVTCLFTEPQFRPALAETLVEGTTTRLGELDPVGGDLESGPDAWFLLMQNLADNLTACLADAES